MYHCERCGSKTYVANTRSTSNAAKRQYDIPKRIKALDVALVARERHCSGCKHKFMTVEIREDKLQHLQAVLHQAAKDNLRHKLEDAGII